MSDLANSSRGSAFGLKDKKQINIYGMNRIYSTNRGKGGQTILNRVVHNLLKYLIALSGLNVTECKQLDWYIMAVKLNALTAGQFLREFR